MKNMMINEGYFWIGDNLNFNSTKNISLNFYLYIIQSKIKVLCSTKKFNGERTLGFLFADPKFAGPTFLYTLLE